MKALYAIQWTEYEAGWGSRPDDITVHPSLEAAKASKLDIESRSTDYSCYVRGSDPELVEVSDELVEALSTNQQMWVFVNSWDRLKTWKPKKQ